MITIVKGPGMVYINQQDTNDKKEEKANLPETDYSLNFEYALLDNIIYNDNYSVLDAAKIIINHKNKKDLFKALKKKIEILKAEIIDITNKEKILTVELIESYNKAITIEAYISINKLIMLDEN